MFDITKMSKKELMSHLSDIRKRLSDPMPENASDYLKHRFELNRDKISKTEQKIKDELDKRK